MEEKIEEKEPPRHQGDGQRHKQVEAEQQEKGRALQQLKGKLLAGRVDLDVGRLKPGHEHSQSQVSPAKPRA